MAHADYHCCAICDSKQEYGGIDSTTKEKICPHCLRALRNQGLSVLDTNELLFWINTTDTDMVRTILHKVDFRFCYYRNPVDEAVEQKGIKMEEESRLIVPS